MRHRSYWRPRAHRYQVVVRSKVRNERIARVAAVLAVLGLGAGAIGVIRHFPRQRMRTAWSEMPSTLPYFLRVDNVSVSGVPEALSRQILASILRPVASAASPIGASAPTRAPQEQHPGQLSPGGNMRQATRMFARAPLRDWNFLEPYRVARRLTSEFPCLDRVRVNRYWLSRTAEFQVALRRPSALATDNGNPAGWLTESGVVCNPPEGTYLPGSWPVVELRRVPASDYPALAQFLMAAEKDGAMPFRLTRFELRSTEEGWEGWLEDGTVLLWGNLSWTEMKLARLREVFSDASRKFHSGLVVDLRYFEDGKILVRPGLGHAPGALNRPHGPPPLPKMSAREI